MIIKQTRIKSGNSETATNYAVTQNSNEAVELLDGDPENLAFYADHASAGAGTKYGLRHFIISPGEPLKPGELDKIVEALRDEWNIGSRPSILTRHSKPGSSGRDDHYHFLVAENDYSGKVLDHTFFKVRNEKVCRILEAEFGHQIIKGRHNKAVLNNILQKIDSEYDPQQKAELKQLGHALYNAGIAQGQLPDPRATAGSKRKADRLNVDLEAFAADFKSVYKNGVADVQELLESHGLEVRPGRKDGYLMLHQGDEVIGSLSRAVGIRVNEMKELYEHIYGERNNEETDRRRKAASKESGIDNIQQDKSSSSRYAEDNRVNNSSRDRQRQAFTDRNIDRRDYGVGHNSQRFEQSSVITDRNEQHDETRTEQASRTLSEAALLKLQNVALTNVMNKTIDPITQPVLAGIRQEQHTMPQVQRNPSDGSLALVKLNKQITAQNAGMLGAKVASRIARGRHRGVSLDAGRSVGHGDGYNAAQSGGNSSVSLDDPELMKKLADQNSYLGMR
jgi:hypothetical protein